MPSSQKLQSHELSCTPSCVYCQQVPPEPPPKAPHLTPPVVRAKRIGHPDAPTTLAADVYPILLDQLHLYLHALQQGGGYDVGQSLLVRIRQANAAVVVDVKRLRVHSTYRFKCGWKVHAMDKWGHSRQGGGKFDDVGVTVGVDDGAGGDDGVVDYPARLLMLLSYDTRTIEQGVLQLCFIRWYEPATRPPSRAALISEQYLKAGNMRAMCEVRSVTDLTERIHLIRDTQLGVQFEGRAHYFVRKYNELCV